MDTPPQKSVFFHFRFKFLAVTSIAFLLYVVLSGTAEFDQFASSPLFKLVGPFFILSGIFFLVFRRVPIKCPHCNKLNPTRKDWTCCECGESQGKDRYLIDKCLHCRQMQTSSECDHCKKTFKL